ncbi:hypothetical protein [Moraxella bovis]|uniref:Uncharacterized protein n=1 Tax=Moraxella bovis TaxID=476 RepID=A0A378PP19_MORBO|nr:hypothetical protein [Moraxella bovis]STY90316.1 Uncharacterised protein [Moraxella bovis]
MSNHSNALPTICPHSNCGKVLNDVIYHHGILFCPHCQKSLLINPFLPELEKMTFWQFVHQFIKRQGKSYVIFGVIMGLFVGLIELIANFDKIHFSAELWITFSALLCILIVIGIYKFEKNLQNHHYYRLKNKPILKGVDDYQSVKDDFKISLALEELKASFYQFTPCCPNCHSQRLHQRIDDFYCQNCHHKFELNPKLKDIKNYYLVASYLVLFMMMIRHFGNNFYYLLFMIPSFFFVNLITQYYWCKTPKWQLQPP